MTLPALILLLVSAGLHAGWNLLGKGEQPTPAFMLAANTLGCLLLLPALVFHGQALAAFSAPVWVYLALTGLCQAVYYVALAGAYRNGDLSVVYPLARASPVLIVAALTLLLGRGQPLTTLSVSGMTLIVAGCLILPMRRFSDFRLQNYGNLTSLLALAAACGTAGYSLIDSEALRLLRPAAGGAPGSLGVTLLYALLEGWATSLWLALFVAARKTGRRALGIPPLEAGANRGRSVDLDALMKAYWAEIGWNPETGVPTPETVENLGLGSLTDS